MAANYFLKLTPEIKGESQQEGYKDQIEVLSYSWGVTQSASFAVATGGSSAQANLQDVSISFSQAAASPKLMEACATGKHFTCALITCLKAGGDKQQKYLEITLENVIVSSYQMGGSGDDHPIDTLSLNFAKIKHEYFAQDDKGVTKSAGVGQYDQRKSSSK